MSKLVTRKSWIPIDDFLAKVNKTKSQMYSLIKNRQWYDGFVVKRPTGGRKYLVGCYEDYEKWLGL